MWLRLITMRRSVDSYIDYRLEKCVGKVCWYLIWAPSAFNRSAPPAGCRYVVHRPANKICTYFSNFTILLTPSPAVLITNMVLTPTLAKRTVWSPSGTSNSTYFSPWWVYVCNNTEFSPSNSDKLSSFWGLWLWSLYSRDVFPNARQTKQAAVSPGGPLISEDTQAYTKHQQVVNKSPTIVLFSPLISKKTKF